MDNRIDRYGHCTPYKTVTFNEDGWGNGVTYMSGVSYEFEHNAEHNEFYVHIGHGGPDMGEVDNAP